MSHEKQLSYEKKLSREIKLSCEKKLFCEKVKKVMACDVASVAIFFSAEITQVIDSKRTVGR